MIYFLYNTYNKSHIQYKLIFQTKYFNKIQNKGVIIIKDGELLFNYFYIEKYWIMFKIYS